MAAKKPAGKAKSAVSGKFITRQSAKENPRETFIDSPNPKLVKLSLEDLLSLRRCFGGEFCGPRSAVYRRITAEINRAIAAHKGKA